MKNNLAKLSLTALSLLLITNVKSQPKQDTQRSEAVFAWAFQAGYNITNEGQSTRYYSGAKVYVSSSSLGAPHFPQYPSTNLVDVAEATATLLSLGYNVKVSDNGLFVFATKQ